MVKRSTMNMDFLYIHDYLFINNVKNGDGFGPFGAAFATSTDPWNKNLDANGYPNHVNHDSKAWGAGIRIPASSDFAGPYVLAWDGSGEVFLDGGTWTIDAGQSSNYTAVNASRWHGTNSRIVVTYSGTFSGTSPNFTLRVQRTNRDGSGNFLTNLRFLRLEDEADYLAGKVFRQGAKQILADLNPGALRFMNWIGSNTCQSVRFEHRTLPDYASYGAVSNWVASPPYPESTGSNNLYSVASATGMPVSMQHGEVVTCRMGNAMVKGGAKTVSAITKANPGVVTATAHGYSTGDVIVHTLNAGMTQLHNVPCTVTVSDANTYSLGVDTSAFSNFTAGTAKPLVTLDVGGRGAYPVVFGDGVVHASNYGNYISQYDYKTFVFDKDLIASTAITGAWTFNNLGAANGHENNPPLEICVALINELMEMTTSDGITVGPIDMWITFPHRGMLSVDPDYSAGSNWATGAVDVILNGANGFDGLDGGCDLIIEYSNETWNSAGTGFDTYPFLSRKAFLRWGTAEVDSYTALRAAIMVNDIKAAYPAHPRVKFVMCGQGTLGVSGRNAIRISGDANYDGDAWNTWGGDPMDHFDYFGVASYFETSSAYKTANDAPDAAAWAAAVGAAAKEIACEACVYGLQTAGGNETLDRYGNTLLPAYAAAMNARGKKYVMYEGGWNDAATGSAFTATSTNGSADLTGVLNSSAGPGTMAVGSYVVGPGVPDLTTVLSSASGTATLSNNVTLSATSAFQVYTEGMMYKREVKRSRAWAEALKNFFNLYDAEPDALYPADYIMTNGRWGHCTPNSYRNGVEGAGLDLAYTLTSLRNRGKRQFVVKT